MSTFLYRAHCPHHEDDTESMGIYADGHGHCYGCGWHGYPNPVPPPPEWHVRRQAMPMDRYDGPLPWSMVDAYVDVLNGPMAWRKQWLQGRGLRMMTIEKLRLGHTGKAFSIPVWGLDGKLETVKYRRDDRIGDEKEPKYRCLPGAEVTLYGGWQSLYAGAVLLCEGELDAARLMQELWLHSDDSYAAVSLTGGCNSMSQGAMDRLCGANMLMICYDQDDPGIQQLVQGDQPVLVELTEAELGAAIRGLNAYLDKVLYKRIDVRMRADPDSDFERLEAEVELVGELVDRLEEVVD
jgi:hypothetical protein